MTGPRGGRDGGRAFRNNLTRSNRARRTGASLLLGQTLTFSGFAFALLPFPLFTVNFDIWLRLGWSGYTVVGFFGVLWGIGCALVLAGVVIMTRVSGEGSAPVPARGFRGGLAACCLVAIGVVLLFEVIAVGHSCQPPCSNPGGSAPNPGGPVATCGQVCGVVLGGVTIEPIAILAASLVFTALGVGTLIVAGLFARASAKQAR